MAPAVSGGTLKVLTYKGLMADKHYVKTFSGTLVYPRDLDISQMGLAQRAGEQETMRLFKISRLALRRM